MSRVYFTHCEFHLGDNLFHLHFLRALARRHPHDQFVHYAHACHLPQLAEMIGDLPGITLMPLPASGARPDSVDAWKNAGGFFERHHDRNDYYGFYVDWFAELAARMGLEPVFESREELLFDYPALKNVTPLDRVLPAFDILFVNSQPCSGQWMPMAYAPNDDGTFLDAITNDLAARHSLVVTQRCAASKAGVARCTLGYGMSVTDIGALSRRCKLIIMIGTGPAWPTMNVWNKGKKRILLFHPERVEGFGDWPHVQSREELRAVLEVEGLL